MTERDPHALANEIARSITTTERLGDRVHAELNRRNIRLSDDDFELVCTIVERHALGFGPLTTLMADQDVTDIAAEAFDTIWSRRPSGWTFEPKVHFANHDEYLNVINRILSLGEAEVTTTRPIADVRLPDGGPRVSIAIPPAVPAGTAALNIRLYRSTNLRLKDLMNGSPPSLSSDMAVFLIACVLARLNIVVAGGTGSGKTTFMSVLMGQIPANERLVLIEDTPELSFATDKPDTRRSVQPLYASNSASSGRTPDELLRASLRMSPDRIIVGECRGPEALTMLTAMNTGHEGSLTSLHANSPLDALARLETLCLHAGSELPYRAIRSQIGSAIHLLVQLRRDSASSLRYVSEIAEVIGHDGELRTRTIFTGRPDGTFSAIEAPTFYDQLLPIIERSPVRVRPRFPSPAAAPAA